MRFAGLALLMLLLAAPAVAGDVVPKALPLDVTGGLLGDAPPVEYFSHVGHAGVSWAVATRTQRELELVDVPAGATILRAFFVTGCWFDPPTTDRDMLIAFGGSSHGYVPPAAVDDTLSLHLAAYIVDVTADVSGNGPYRFTAQATGSGTGSYGHLLVVIYEEPEIPLTRVALAFGSESLQNAASETVLAGFHVGPARLLVFTEADNGGQPGDESIRIDGNVVAGGGGIDLFAANDGGYTSAVELPVMLHGPGPRIGVATGDDTFGWHVALLSQPIGSLSGQVAFTRESLEPATAGRAYLENVTVAGGLAPHVFGATGLPPGLVMSADGRIHGSPPAAGRYEVTVKVRDASGSRELRSYVLVVAERSVAGR